MHDVYHRACALFCIKITNDYVLLYKTKWSLSGCVVLQHLPILPPTHSSGQGKVFAFISHSYCYKLCVCAPVTSCVRHAQCSHAIICSCQGVWMMLLENIMIMLFILLYEYIHKWHRKSLQGRLRWLNNDFWLQRLPGKRQCVCSLPTVISCMAF